jgi:hypothetical protein
VAFPGLNVTDRSGGNSGADQTAHVLTLPTNIVSGDLLLMFFAVDGTDAGDLPAGWTREFNTSGNTRQFTLYRRTSDGGEGSTITVNTASAEGSAYTGYRISDWNALEKTTDLTGTNSSSPNSPSLTPTWGAKDTLWLSACGYDPGNRSISTYPASYINGRNDRWSNGNGVGVGSATRLLNATSDDPGAFTLSANAPWFAATIAIEPSAAGGPDDVTFVDGATGTSVTNTVQIAKADLAGLSDGDFVVVHLGAHVNDATGWSLSGWTQADLKNTS